jgi:peptidoglycan/xylan/chitin deacetylase (PgdA/CDA1 family)
VEGPGCTAILSFDVDAESPILAHDRAYAKHAMVMTHQAFGPLVGVPRLLALLSDYDLPATFFVPGVTALRYPQTVQEILAAGHEIGHHSHTHISPVDMTEAQEREDFERALEVLRAQGVEVRGHRAAMWEASWRTAAIVAEHGLTYDSSLMDSDRAYVLATDAGEIAEVCPFWGLDDWEQYAFLPRPEIGSNLRSPAAVAEMWIYELDAMRRHGALFVLTCHPFLSGRAGRVEALRTLIEAALTRGDVEFASCSEVAERTLADAHSERRRHDPGGIDVSAYPAEESERGA